jgi:hypothetical protein
MAQRPTYPRPLCVVPECPRRRPATGRGCIRPSRGRRSAPGRRTYRRVQDPGGPDRPLAEKRQQWRGPADRLEWLKVRSRGSHKAARRTKENGPGHKSPSRGCRKATPGVPRRAPGGFARSLEAGPAGSAGAGGKPAPGLPRGTRVPVAPFARPQPAEADSAWGKARSRKSEDRKSEREEAAIPVPTSDFRLPTT